MSENSNTGKTGKNRKVTKRALQAIETRNRIYETAIKIMRSDGFENMTVGQISEEANVSVGAFYHHFKSKYDILDEMFDEADAYFEKHVIPRLKGLATSEKIIAYFVQYANFNRQQGIDHIKALYATHSANFTNQGRFMFTGLHNIIKSGIENGEIVSEMDSRETAQFLFMSARGIVFNWCSYKGEYSLEDTMHKYIALQLKLFSP